MNKLIKKYITYIAYISVWKLIENFRQLIFRVYNPVSNNKSNLYYKGIMIHYHTNLQLLQ